MYLRRQVSRDTIAGGLQPSLSGIVQTEDYRGNSGSLPRTWSVVGRRSNNGNGRSPKVSRGHSPCRSTDLTH